MKQLKTAIDAQEMAKKYPITFEAPTQAVLNRIKKGKHVKVAYNQERFWILVTKVVGDTVIGTVDNDLVLRQDIKYGDLVSVQKNQVYDVM
jgi:hypothetical protein